MLTIIAAAIFGTMLEVGPGKPYQRIEDAVKAAKGGDTILVYPSPDRYKATAVRIQIPKLTIRGVGKVPVEIRGGEFDYSGAGSVPRAIIQVEPSGEGSTIQNLDLSGAHNKSFNGAGVRIQSASNVTIDNCIIHGNDMGIMSNGKEGDPKAASDQLIEYCLIEKNGNQKDPGYNHNLYLGGTSVRLFRCEIRNSITGHNVKSRAHFTQIEACYIHDAANREIDLPESWDTTRPFSNALVIGNRIIKDPNCQGNRGVIEFGAEKGTHVGNIYLFCNIVVTPFATEVVSLSSPVSSIIATDNIFLNLEQDKAALFVGAMLPQGNYLSSGYPVYLGNTYGKKRSESFGLSLPNYLCEKPFNQVQVNWVDGTGTKCGAKCQMRTDFVVGPNGSRTMN